MKVGLHEQDERVKEELQSDYSSWATWNREKTILSQMNRTIDLNKIENPTVQGGVNLSETLL